MAIHHLPLRADTPEHFAVEIVLFFVEKRSRNTPRGRADHPSYLIAARPDSPEHRQGVPFCGDPTTVRMLPDRAVLRRVRRRGARAAARHRASSRRVVGDANRRRDRAGDAVADDREDAVDRPAQGHEHRARRSAAARGAHNRVRARRGALVATSAGPRGLKRFKLRPWCDDTRRLLGHVQPLRRLDGYELVLDPDEVLLRGFVERALDIDHCSCAVLLELVL